MQNVYSVSWVNAYIRDMISQDFLLGSLYVKGEASNVKYHSSGHLYFTLKDGQGSMPCVMFAGNRGGLKFRLEEGSKIVVLGNIDVYERDGRYQLYAKEITLEGVGLLYEKFEQLKRKLEEMGMFDPMYKKEIPPYIKRLGVVTAPTGAAVRDIISITKRRNPGVEIILYPALVQGDGAPASIISGINALEELGVDVMIVGRGGGSIEDLWAFNEEAVAQAIFSCSVPIISAVGHETDTTIADFVADLRAPTPSAAAELAVFEREEVKLHILEKQKRLQSLMEMKIERERTRLAARKERLFALSPKAKLNEKRMSLLHMEERLEGAMDKRLSDLRNLLALYAQKLDGASPLKKLESGYAFLRDKEGKRISHIDRLSVGKELSLYVTGGFADVTVTKLYKEKSQKAD